VAEVYVGLRDRVEQGQPVFKLDSSEQEAAVETARRKIVETEAALEVASADVIAAEGQITQAEGAYQQALDELNTKRELAQRNANVVARREIERLEVMAAGRKGAVDAAVAAKQAAETRLSALLPAQKASAQAELAQAQVELDKTVIRAGVTGQVEQFALQVGDIVNPFMRAAGVLIPEGFGRRAVHAGFSQIEAQVMEPGMVAEVSCVSKPWTIIPMVVTQVQDYIAAGQFRGGEQLIDPQQVAKPGTLLVFLEPLYEGGLKGVTPGSSCIANAYSNHHDMIASGEVSGLRAVGLHVVDAVGFVHAMLLRIQVLLLPLKALVFSGGH
jgi:multidrug resistance efflux pump